MGEMFLLFVRISTGTSRNAALRAMVSGKQDAGTALERGGDDLTKEKEGDAKEKGRLGEKQASPEPGTF